MEENTDYITEAMELMGIDLTKPKQIVQEISGFTPIFDVVAKEHGNVTAAVHGCAWRFCQMPDGVCKASLATIGELLSLDPATVSRHMKTLVDNGYLVDLSPDLRNRPHVYADTGKVVMRSKLNAGIAERKATVAHSKATVAESTLSKDSNKDDKNKSLSSKDYEQVNAKVDAMITNSARADWTGREAFRSDHYPLVDWYHKVTGQDCPMSKRKDWMKAVSLWSSNALTVADLQAAYDMDISWRGVFTSPNQLTDKAIALKAQKQAQPQERPEYQAVKHEQVKAIPNPMQKPRLT